MAVELIRENCTRKIDSLGRISIPKGIRDRLEIGTNEELEFFTMGKYICIRKAKQENKYARLAKTMREMGLEVPEEVERKMREPDDGDEDDV